MGNERSLFDQIVFTEAEETPEEETAEDTSAENPPDDMPDVPYDEEPADDGGGDPPDVPGLDDFEDEPEGSQEEGQEEETKEPEVGEKISAAMNSSLYQQFMTMINTISNQLGDIRNNNDVIFVTAPDALSITKPLSKLADNIRLYLANNFVGTNYSKNLLFYNKCLNQLNLLTEIFTRKLQQGNKDAK